jgi:hypothetical protein
MEYVVGVEDDKFDGFRDNKTFLLGSKYVGEFKDWVY